MKSLVERLQWMDEDFCHDTPATASDIAQEAATQLEAKDKLIAELVEALDQSVELLHIIKEHWVDYDHVYSINDAEGRALVSKARQPTPSL
jgi:hypothetical protein